MAIILTGGYPQLLWKVAVMRKLMAAAVAAATIGAMVAKPRASVPASVLTSARIEHRGPTLELHFGFSGALSIELV